MKQLESYLFLYFYKFHINYLDVETESASLEMLRLTLWPPNSVPIVLCKELGLKWPMYCLECYCPVTSLFHCMITAVFLQHQRVSGVERWNLNSMLNLIFVVIYSQTLIWHHCLFTTVFGDISRIVVNQNNL
jgi:hypothetical protein